MVRSALEPWYVRHDRSNGPFQKFSGTVFVFLSALRRVHRYPGWSTKYLSVRRIRHTGQISAPYVSAMMDEAWNGKSTFDVDKETIVYLSRPSSALSNTAVKDTSPVRCLLRSRWSEMCQPHLPSFPRQTNTQSPARCDETRRDAMGRNEMR